VSIIDIYHLRAFLTYDESVIYDPVNIKVSNLIRRKGDDDPIQQHDQRNVLHTERIYIYQAIMLNHFFLTSCRKDVNYADVETNFLILSSCHRRMRRRNYVLAAVFILLPSALGGIKSSWRGNCIETSKNLNPVQKTFWGKLELGGREFSSPKDA
jgi:hypothetical protein